MNTLPTLNTPRIGVPLHVLRRLASRSVKVVARHAQKHGAIEVYQDTFVPVALEFIAGYDTGQNAGPDQKKEVTEADDARLGLRRVGMAWAAHLERDIPGIDLSAFKRTSVAADDLIDATSRVLIAIADRATSGTGPLSYGDKVTADLESALASAVKEHEEAQDLLATLQENAAAVRKLAAEVQAGLVALRRTLRATLGRTHRDYQKLRQAKARLIDEDDPEVEAGQSSPGDQVVVPPGEEPAGIDEEELEAGEAGELAEVGE